MARPQVDQSVPIWHKSNMTIPEAAAYTGIGECKLRKMADADDCPFVLWIGTKRLIRRVRFEEYLTRAFSV